MITLQNRILDKKQILQKTRRMAFEIYENNFEEKEIILAGIYDRGYFFAEMLKAELEKISELKVVLVKITLEKFAASQNDIHLDCQTSSLINKSIIVVDDVLNTGRTLIYCLRPFLELKIKSLQTAVIVDRSHRLFPISANYTGYGLSTTIQEHIHVILDNEDNFGVYLH
jgi:pyrimidine operon attenuation protein / uracil phosphoribosyltransferase